MKSTPRPRDAAAAVPPRRVSADAPRGGRGAAATRLRGRSARRPPRPVRGRSTWIRPRSTSTRPRFKGSRPDAGPRERRHAAARAERRGLDELAVAHGRGHDEELGVARADRVAHVRRAHAPRRRPRVQRRVARRARSGPRAVARGGVVPAPDEARRGEDRLRDHLCRTAGAHPLEGRRDAQINVRSASRVHHAPAVGGGVGARVACAAPSANAAALSSVAAAPAPGGRKSVSARTSLPAPPVASSRSLVGRRGRGGPARSERDVRDPARPRGSPAVQYEPRPAVGQRLGDHALQAAERHLEERVRQVRPAREPTARSGLLARDGS